MPPAGPLEVVTQFTEDVFATEDRFCERPSCEQPVIREGEPYYYVASRNASTPGRFVCLTCYRRYLKAPSTTVKPSAASVGMAPPNADVIRQSVNAGQRGSIADAPSVVPMHPGPVRQATHHGPMRAPLNHPQAALPYSQLRGPDVLTPGSSIPPQRIQGLGYSQNHIHYHREREYRSPHGALAPGIHSVPSALTETISLTISAVYEGNKRGQSQGIPFGNIKEGKKDIDAMIDAPGLDRIARDTVVPKIRAFCPEFPWRVSEFVVRDARWVDLSTHPRSAAYFYRDCLQPGRKASKPVFKTKGFSLMVVVPASQWCEYEKFFEDMEKKTTERAVDIPRRISHNPRLTRSTTEQASHFPTNNTSLFLPAPTAAHSLPPNSSVDTQAVVAKRGHQHKSSTSSITSITPPPSKKAAVASPSRDTIRQALEMGGTADLDVKSVINHMAEAIVLHPINLCPFEDILKDCMVKPRSGSLHENAASGSVEGDPPLKRTAWQLDPMGGHVGQLAINKSTSGLVGMGAFKTAYDGILTLSSLTPSGLGSVHREKVVVKQPFFKTRSSTGKLNIIHRYTISTNLTKLFREANILYWAKSLLDLTYTFIDTSIASSPVPLPFDIPRLRFVEAGLALVHSPTQKSPDGLGVYLLEEKIKCTEREFIKFIHNRDFSPSVDSDDNGYDVAEFLVFTQHVQYMKTKGLAYISDYQGSTSLLTDPQILTDPSLGVGQDMFGDGNLSDGVKSFKEHHLCNRYCRWPGFGLEAFRAEEGNSVTA